MPSLVKILIMFCCVYPIKYLAVSPYIVMLIQVVLGVVVYLVVSLVTRDENLKYILALLKKLLQRNKGESTNNGEYNSIQERRKKGWLKNAIRFRCARIFRGRRDKNLWIFSAWEGKKYADNSKYLFEYVLEHHPKIKCVWQTQNEQVFEDLSAKGYPVQLIGTNEANETQKRAGVAIYTNGLDDFGGFPLIYGAKLVCLWHGVGFKKMYRSQLLKTNVLKRFMSRRA